MKYSDLEAGQEFIIIGRKTPHGFIALETGEAFYKIDGDVPVSAQQSVQPTLLTEREFEITCQNCGSVVGHAIGKTQSG